MDNQQKSSLNRAFSPYLRKPIRSLDEVRHDDRRSDAERNEQAHERLDNNAFRTSDNY
ncbi:hypothetical protein [Rhodovibrio salinarum]|uniref:hypothetical protein n=1 Tax=Rhodovibrio salinarum TaxID=1087 RepID=UPI0004B10545|nr:hypothetical protein [Rhodovibrio salinarum]